MKQILYIVPNLYTSSGVSTTIMNYYNNIDKEKFHIDFLVMKKYKQSYEKELLCNKSKITYLENNYSIMNIMKIKKEVKEFFKNNRYDIVELHAPTFSFIFLNIAKKYNMPVRIVHSHSTIHSANKVKNFLSIILNINLKKHANQFFACSEKSGKYWYGNKICNSDKYNVIKNGINTKCYRFDEDKRKKLRREYNLDNNTVIGFVGRISKEKNLLFFIDVMKQIVKENNNYKFLVVGDGLELKKIKRKSKNISDNIIFLGMRKDVNELLNCMDLLVLPSKREGLPMVAIEAQLTNLECFLSNTITTEIDIGAIRFLKLNKQIWKDEILNFKKEKKTINRDQFDIIKCSKQLEKKYEEISKQK